jgi:hypothetical protein
VPIDVALRKLGLDLPVLISARFRRCKDAQLLACVLVVAFCAVTIAGCERVPTVSRTTKSDISTRSASRPRIISVPGRELLNPQAEPDCEFKTSDPKADERQKLDYERQCYRHAEMIVRTRLQLLQASVNETIKAVKRSER